jgi:hypothetical protein
MKMKLILVVVSLGLMCGAVNAQDEKKAPGGEGASKGKAEAAKGDKAVGTPSQEELEARFKTMLTKAVLTGRWSPIENARLGPEKDEDKYEIVSAGKVSGDQWVINARMRYGKNEMVLPISVQVKWSGETPMIIVNNLSMGGNKSYSARVLFFDGTYSGSWNSSAGYGGVLYGTVDHIDPYPKPDGAKK